MAVSRIEAIYIVKLSDVHIPYILGCKVVGPRRGEYMLDKFNFEQLLKNYNNGKYYWYTDLLERAIVSHTQQVYIRGEVKGDKGFIELAKNLGLTPLVRLEGLDKTKRIAKTLGLSVEILETLKMGLGF